MIAREPASARSRMTIAPARGARLVSRLDRCRIDMSHRACPSFGRSISAPRHPGSRLEACSKAAPWRAADDERRFSERHIPCDPVAVGRSHEPLVHRRVGTHEDVRSARFGPDLVCQQLRAAGIPSEPFAGWHTQSELDTVLAPALPCADCSVRSGRLGNDPSDHPNVMGVPCAGASRQSS
jgi:hypothetical protein